MPTKRKSSSAKRRKSGDAQRDADLTYDEFKEYEGRKYTGMKIGRSHKWYYDQGEWKEKKITPDLWQIDYAVTKRRAGRAPEGSGVPVGTEYHWYILAHQNVRKLNANDYTTALTGLKFKVAHKRAERGTWSATPKTQRKRMIRFLRDVIADLETEPEEAVSEVPQSTDADRPTTRSNTASTGRATGKARRGQAATPPSMSRRKRGKRLRRRTDSPT
jgi:hypothetical protein